ncbi:MAG: hypothetical protein ISR58_16790 [Anaerolineales bacterium]|nr:hypothetical protein [Chloroflexota bacterium]MBL6982832.1 hypothetical protein [Anaerolineales bacterium]
MITNDHLAYVDEEFLVEITKPEEKTDELIIAVSFTRTYTFSQPEAVSRNGRNKADQPDIQEIRSSLN